jgi:hypothetical protein
VDTPNGGSAAQIAKAKEVNLGKLIVSSSRPPPLILWAVARHEQATS